MTWWFAPFYDGFMRKAEEACVAGWRKELLAGVSGDVLDLGAGTGANLPYFSRDARIVAAEPDPAMAKQLRVRARELHVAVDVVSAEAESLPFKDDTFDAVVSTLVLCTVRDPDRALSEIRRVLKPGSKLYFLEHVAADDAGRYRWQRLLEPVWKPLAGGCHLTRRTHEAIERAGFTIDSIERESMRKAVPVVRPSVRGVATAR
jgi:ubiquinone/menaquinone biosynthesis C-methylase UbiE